MSTVIEPTPTIAASPITVWDALLRQAAVRPQTRALLSVDAEGLTYEELWLQTLVMAEALRSMDIGSGHVVAVGLPDGPHVITATLAVTAVAAAIPINPMDPEAESLRRLREAEAHVVLLDAGQPSPLRDAAGELGIATLEVRCEARVAGQWRLAGQSSKTAIPDTLAEADARALLLPTSGTTGASKLVAKSHRQFLARARDRANWLELGKTDRLLAIASPYYAHAWTAVLGTLLSGGSIACSLPFTPEGFFETIARYQPSWYTAVPAVHRAIISAAPKHRDIVAGHQLRFVRSGSAPLAPALQADLEQLFGVPAIQGYSLTEADIASNPLPPQTRKPGSAGLPCAHEVAVVDERGLPLTTGQPGEIMFRLQPDHLTPGSIADWTATGDMGYFDHDGYLFITGRSKELICRGGAKVPPLEVEDALLRHPAVEEAVVFAIPHPRLGEDVGGAVTLKPHTETTERELITFAASQLASFKVPHRLAILRQLPIGPAGKVQRRALASQLGFLEVSPERHERNGLKIVSQTEALLADLWRETLEIEHVGPDDEFFELGGDSLAAVLLLAAVGEQTGVHLPPASIFEGTTIRRMAHIVDMGGTDLGSDELIAVQPKGTKKPFFCVHPISGEVLCFAHLARHLGFNQPFYGLQHTAPSGESIHEQAERYAEAMVRLQPQGPYLLGGYSAGGTVALETAQQLQHRGEEVALLAIIDHPAPYTEHRETLSGAAAAMFLRRDLPRWVQDFVHRGAQDRATAIPYSVARIRGWLQAAAHGGPAASPLDAITDLDGLPEGYRRQYQHRMLLQHRALHEYRPQRYVGHVTLFRAYVQPLLSSHDSALGWRTLASEGVDVHEVPGTHLTMLREPHVRHLARRLEAHLAAAAP